MDEPLLEMLRDDLTRRVSSVTATMTDTLRLLAMARELAGDRPGGDALGAAIAELTAARDGLMSRP
ncbi:hypothetical protein GCM10010168_55950 [Actinoplanes ianthinogenes]|uniref:Uncharacterized protein n=1 Tax=Actinoplanes ianthinogenes TaxID=122358 RepID=A0ABM7LQA5_9ACTN|nr:hypothetical protein [Actinoplanes ianthinogenes]BCJ41406.1 hypothetical protein Aiant_20630 [Actinoplanes ianthinogenes]GGR30354.1 hypothetical protein GCM10010168_55950 [Actinoplanes ianthinogenes]